VEGEIRDGAHLMVDVQHGDFVFVAKGEKPEAATA
jgi:hypothetical protein